MGITTLFTFSLCRGKLGEPTGLFRRDSTTSFIPSNPPIQHQIHSRFCSSSALFHREQSVLSISSLVTREDSKVWEGEVRRTRQSVWTRRGSPLTNFSPERTPCQICALLYPRPTQPVIFIIAPFPRSFLFSRLEKTEKIL